jgi:hypothetical protein
VPTNPPNPDERLVAIVDDDASVRQSARRLIRSHGYRAEAFGSAEEFLDSGQAKTTACMILDLRMPRLDGLELQRRLSGSAIPIVSSPPGPARRRSGGRCERAPSRSSVSPSTKRPCSARSAAVFERSENDGGSHEND